MYVITYFNRRLGKAVEAKYETLELANVAATAIFLATGVVVGIDRE